MSDSSFPPKPVAKTLGWQVASSRLVFESERFNVREDEVAVPGRGKPLTFAYAERSTGVIIVPVTPEGEVVLIRQYRYPADAWCLETPAGSTGDTGDMPLEEVVRKELKEEIGATAERVERIGQFFGTPSYSTEVCVVFVAWNTRLEVRPEPEPTEKIKVELVSAAEAVRRAESGEIHTASTALGLIYARRFLQAAGWI